MAPWTGPTSASTGTLVRATLSKTQAVMDAMRHAIETRRDLLDKADDLGAVTVTVKLHAGTTTIKSVVFSDERVNRRLQMR